MRKYIALVLTLVCVLALVGCEKDVYKRQILNITQGFSAAFENALPSVYPLDLLVGIVGAVIILSLIHI